MTTLGVNEEGNTMDELIYVIISLSIFIIGVIIERKIELIIFKDFEFNTVVVKIQPIKKSDDSTYEITCDISEAIRGKVKVALLIESLNKSITEFKNPKMYFKGKRRFKISPYKGKSNINYNEKIKFQYKEPQELCYVFPLNEKQINLIKNNDKHKYNLYLTYKINSFLWRRNQEVLFEFDNK